MFEFFKSIISDMAFKRKFSDQDKEQLVLAKKGNADAQYYIGMIYFNGSVVDEDYDQSAKWFIKAADNGHPEAQERCVKYFEHLSEVAKPLQARLNIEVQPDNIYSDLALEYRTLAKNNPNGSFMRNKEKLEKQRMKEREKKRSEQRKLDMLKEKLLKNLRSKLKEDLADAKIFYDNFTDPNLKHKTAGSVALFCTFSRNKKQNDDHAFKSCLWAGLGKGQRRPIVKLSRFYRDGVGVAPNPDLSREFLVIAAKLGDEESITALKDLDSSS